MGNLCSTYKDIRLEKAQKRFEKKIEEYNYILQNIENQILVKKKYLQEMGQCGICFENTCNIVYVTCGHTICSNCDEKKQIQECPFCREQISWKQKIYRL